METTNVPPAVDTTNIAVINTNIIYIQRDIADIKLALKETYATKTNLDDITKALDIRIKRLEDESNLWRWLSPTLSFALGSMIVFLLQNYLIHLH